MATSKKYDLAVKVGEYVSNGKTKARYVTVGSMMERDDGGTFLLLDRTFNPAGVPNPDNKDSVIVGMFDPRKQGEDGGGQQRQQSSSARAPAQQPDNFDDDIPF